MPVRQKSVFYKRPFAITLSVRTARRYGKFGAHKLVAVAHFPVSYSLAVNSQSSGKPGMFFGLVFKPAFTAVNFILQQHRTDSHPLIIVHTQPKYRKSYERQNYY